MLELYNPLYGNQDLKPVVKDNYELTFGFKLLPQFTAEITGFYYNPKDYIALNNAVTKYVNYGEIENKGIDLQMRYNLGRGSSLNLSYTMIDIDLMLGGQSVTT